MSESPRALRRYEPNGATHRPGDLAQQLHPSNWLGDDVGRRISDLIRQTSALRVELLRLSQEFAETLEQAGTARQAVVHRLCGPRGSSPVRQVVSDRLALMTIGPLVELWRTIADDARAAMAFDGYSSNDSLRWATDPASPSEPA